MNLFRRCKHDKVRAHTSERGVVSGKVTVHMTCLNCASSLKQELGGMADDDDLIRDVLNSVMQAKEYTVLPNATYERT